jgi:hypothetical protein
VFQGDTFKGHASAAQYGSLRFSYFF